MAVIPEPFSFQLPGLNNTSDVNRNRIFGLASYIDSRVSALTDGGNIMPRRFYLSENGLFGSWLHEYTREILGDPSAKREYLTHVMIPTLRRHHVLVNVRLPKVEALYRGTKFSYSRLEAFQRAYRKLPDLLKEVSADNTHPTAIITVHSADRHPGEVGDFILRSMVEILHHYDHD